MESIIRITRTALEATANGCILTLQINRDGSEISTVYCISASLNLLEKLQEGQATFMKVVGEELKHFEFERYPDGGVTLRLRTNTCSIDTEMTDVVELVPIVVPF